MSDKMRFILILGCLSVLFNHIILLVCLNTGVEHLLRDVKDTTISTLANEVNFLTITCLALQSLQSVSCD